MKKLGKLKLKDYHEMNDGEMKRVVGGGPNGCNSSCSGSCWADGYEGSCAYTSSRCTCGIAYVG